MGRRKTRCIARFPSNSKAVVDFNGICVEMQISTVCVVLPLSVAFLFAYKRAMYVGACVTHRISCCFFIRQASLFNVIVYHKTKNNIL